MTRQLAWFISSLCLGAMVFSGCKAGDKKKKKPDKPAIEDTDKDGGEDAVALAFVYVGCNRVGWGEKTDPATLDVGRLCGRFYVDRRLHGNDSNHQPRKCANARGRCNRSRSVVRWTVSR